MKHPHDNDDRTIPSPVSTEDLQEPGIRVGEKGFYDPERGARKEKTERPEPIYGPLLATDPGQPDNIQAGGIRRESARALDRSETLDKAPQRVVNSKDDKPSGRKSPTPKG